MQLLCVLVQANAAAVYFSARGSERKALLLRA